MVETRAFPEVYLRTICTGGQFPVVDIVSIPSLPQLQPSYQPRDETSWIQDVFSHHFPTARVLLFRYEVAKSPAELEWLQILRHGTDLLYELVHQRSQPHQMARPLVFICHSFGGMILKQALIEASQILEFRTILDSTKGILFFGCIHNHTPATFEKACLQCAALEMCIPLYRYDKKFCSQDKWRILRDVMDNFRELPIHFPIWSYCESRKTPYKTRRWMRTESSVICAEPLARLNHHNEVFFEVDMDHHQISRFPTRGHPLFKDILDVLNGMLAACKHPQPSSATLFTDKETQTFHSSPSGSYVATPTSPSSSGGLEPPPHKPTRELRLPCHSLGSNKGSEHFVGRASVLSSIYDRLRPGNPESSAGRPSIYVLCGLGGVGKTQVALQFAMRFNDTFQAILFAHADESVNILNDFARFAIRLGLVDPDEQDSLYCSERLRKWFEETDIPWLLILDNADNSDDGFREFWPKDVKGSGSILITTRTRQLAVTFRCPLLPPLPEAEAVDLLVRSTSSDTHVITSEDGYLGRNEQELKAARKIVRRVGCLPLGIHHAANLIIADFCSFQESVLAHGYTDLFASVRRAGFHRYPDGEQYPHDLLTVWAMNFATLSEGSQQLMNLLSYLNPDKIELEMLSNGAKKFCQAGESWWSIVANGRTLVKLKKEMVQSSLLEQNLDQGTLHMHRLVQAACQQRMTPLARQDAFLKASHLLYQIWPVAPRQSRHRPELWPQQEGLLSHVLTLCRSYETSQRPGNELLEGSREFAELLYNASWYNYERGAFEHSEPLLRGAEHFCLRHNGCDLILADIYGARASVATEINQPETALENFKLQYEAIDRAVKYGMLKLPDIRYGFCWNNTARHRGREDRDHVEHRMGPGRPHITVAPLPQHRDRQPTIEPPEHNARAASQPREALRPVF